MGAVRGGLRKAVRQSQLRAQWASERFAGTPFGYLVRGWRRSGGCLESIRGRLGDRVTPLDLRRRGRILTLACWPVVSTRGRLQEQGQALAFLQGVASDEMLLGSEAT